MLVSPPEKVIYCTFTQQFVILKYIYLIINNYLLQITLVVTLNVSWTNAKAVVVNSALKDETAGKTQ